MSIFKSVFKWLNKTAKSKAGFTLIEMLAAVGVAGVLGGIVTPAAINSLAKGRQAKCAENLRQFGTALVQYVSDTGTYPPSASETGSGDVEVRQRWFNILSPYMGADERARTNAQGATGVNNKLGDLDQTVFNRAFICPEVEGQWKIGRNNSYAYNHQYLGNARTAVNTKAGAKGNGFVNFPVKLLDLKDPSRTIAIADTDGTGHIGPYKSPLEMLGPESTGGVLVFAAAGNGQDTWGAGGSLIADRLTTIGNEGYQIDPTFLPCRNLDEDVTDTALARLPNDICGAAGGKTRHAQAARGIVSNRHDGGANVAFADGHVEFFIREAVYVDPRTGIASNRLWNGFGRDNDEDGDGIVKTGDPIFDSNEWIADIAAKDGKAGAGEANTVIGADVGAATKSGFIGGSNGGFMVGANVLDSTVASDVINARGGQQEEAFILDKDGPTTPKVIPFPLITTVLAQGN